MKEITKGIVFIFALMLVTKLLFPQNSLETGFTTEGIETVIRNTELLIEEPLVNKIRDKKKQFSGEKETNSGMKIGAGTMLNNTGKYLSFSINYYYKNFDFAAQLPYYLNKKIKYSLETFETKGVGDFAVGLGYRTEISDILYYAHLDVKLPTGDAGKMENDFLVPLGTGSTDFMIFASANKNITEYISIAGNFAYKYNGSSSKTAEISRFDDPDNNVSTDDIESVEYAITNGNFLAVNANFAYSFDFGLTIDTKLGFKTIGQGNTDKDYSYSWNDETEQLSGLTNKQDVKMLDFKIAAIYSKALFDISAGIKLPLYTKRNEDNLEDNRGVGIFLKFDYNIF